MILAGIDIGTNTLRLLIADIGRGYFREIFSDRRMTRLGEGLDRTGLLAPEARRRTLDALRDFSENIRRHAVVKTAAIGTSALRRASNTPSFISEAKRTTGLAVTVISGEDEARLMLLGVRAALPERNCGNRRSGVIVIDIGGGSTEIIMNGPDQILKTASLALGTVYLNERFIKSDPPSPAEMERLRSAVRKELVETAAFMKPGRSCRFIGTAGTITTLASVAQGLEHYDPGKITGYVLSRECIDELLKRFCSMNLEARTTIRGLERDRGDIIVAGAIVTREIMEYYGYTSLLVSDGGLREGIIYRIYAESVGLPISAGGPVISRG